MPCVRDFLRRSTCALSAFALFLASSPIGAVADTLPTSGRVTAGSATIGAPTNGTMTINQSSNRAVINWNSFSIGGQNAVNFNQPGTGSAVLNRVTGNTTSTIAGKLTGNGQVFLVNPNGIAITPTGTVEVGGGFVASSLNIRNSDFMSGNLSFSGTGGAVSNAGSISVGTGGFAALLGGSVSNSGTITVPQGRIGLGAGSRATLDLTGDGFLQIARASSGTGGTARMTGAQVREAVRNVVNMGGSAQTVSGRNGRIVLGGGGQRIAASRPVQVATAGAVSNTGALTAAAGKVVLSGKAVTIDKGTVSTASLDAKGGSIVITAADTIALLSARLDASGATGGGSIKVGGDAEGKGTLLHAQGVSIDATSTLIADATRLGNGGQIVVWSDGPTIAHGSFSARAGAEGGNGGQIETSGHTVNFEGIRVNAKAVGGIAGTWLIDPEDLIVNSSAAATIAATLNNNATNVGLKTTSTTATGTGQRAAGAGDIIINADLTWSSAATLFLDAYHGIIFNANVTANGGGKVSMVYNNGAGLTGVATDNLLRFVPGKSLSFDAAGGQTGRLTINGAAYKLIFTRAQLEAINSELTVQAGASANYFLDPGDKVIGGNYALGTNLDLAGKTYNGAVLSPGATANNPPPIAGVFEGLGHTIANMNITVPRELPNNGGLAPNSYGVGFIGFLTGTVRDIGIVSGSIGLAPGTNNSTYDSQLVGGLVGFATADSVITTSYSAVSVTGGQSIGGLVGDTVGRVSYSYATGAVSGLAYLGGLVGSQGEGNFRPSSPTSSITNSYATGTVSSLSSTGRDVNGNLATFWGATSGGLAGEWYVGTISNSYATGDVLKSAGTSGGLVGRTGNVTYSSVYASGRVDKSNLVSTSYMGGLIGSVYASTGTNTFTNGAYFNAQANPGLSAVGSFQTNTTYGAWTPANSNGAATGRTSADMTAGNIFAGFSSSAWSATAGSTPKLTAWNPPPAPATVLVTYTTADVVATYGTLAALGGITLAGVAPADAANVTGAITLYDGNNNVVTLSPTLAAGTYFERVTSLSGSAASGYSIPSSGNTIGKLIINPLALNLTGSRIYDGTAGVQGNSLVVNNRVGNDVVTVGGSASLGSRGAGNALISSFGNLTLSNPNYTTTGAFGLVKINPRVVTLSGAKTYDGLASVDGIVLTAGNLVGSDLVTVGGTGTLASANAGSQSLTSTANLTLSNANYTLVGASGSVTINPRVVTLSGSKIYDGLTSVQGIVLTAGNLAGNDVVTVGGTGTLASANAGNQALTSLAGLTLSNANYTLTGASGAVTVTPRPVTLAGNKTYDGLASVPGTMLSVSNLAGNDAVTVGGIGTLASANAGKQAVTSFSNLTLSNTNYTLTGASGSVTIAPRAVTLAGSKTYDGTTTVAGSSLTLLNLVQGDAVSVGGSIANALASPNVGQQNLLALNGLTLSSNNYTLAGGSGSLMVTPRAITITADSQSRAAGQPNPPLSFAITAGTLANGDAFTGALATVATAVSVPGTYSIDQGTLSASRNYTLTYVPGIIVVTVNPALAGSPLGQLTPVNFAPQGAGGQNPQVVCDASAIAGKLRSTGSAPLSTFSASGCGQ